MACIAIGGDDDDIGGEEVGGRVTDGIKRSGGGSKCCPPGITEECRKLPWKFPATLPADIPLLDNAGISGELDPDDDDFLASS